MKLKYIYIALFLTFAGMICLPQQLVAQELDCDDDDDDDGGDDDDGDDIDIPVVHAFDPNDITGPVGYDSLRWVSHKTVMGYTVRFENDPNFATAPAQKVTINHPIDDEMNMFSFRVGEFGFGNFIFSVPPNSAFYNKRLDVVDSLGVFVDVTIGLDVTNRSAFWIFQSIDPATGLAGTVPANVGFLPVNDTAINRFNNFNTQKGEGFVTFTLQPHNQVQTGDTADADASIVFDFNAPIPTNIWTNIIDAKGPTSALDPLPSVVDTTFVLSCTAIDDPGGVGVASFAIYVSEDGAPFYRIAADIPIDSSFVFQGKSGTNYCMYSLGKDWVGNVEKVKTQPDNCVFRQVKGDLIVSSPNGGEMLCPKDTLLITWQHDLIPEIDILYSPDSGANFFPVATEVSTDGGSYLWPLPDSLVAGTQYLIRIENSATHSLIDTSDAVFAILQTLSKPGITASGPLTFCEMDQVSLAGQAGFSKYLWSTGDTTISIQVDTTGNFTLQVEDVNGCLSPVSDPVQTSVNPLPAQPTITAAGSLTFCQGDSVLLSAPTGFANYNWSTSDNSQDITVKNAGGYTVSVVDANGCESPVSAAVMVMVDTLPQTPVINALGPSAVCQGNFVDLRANTSVPYSTYIWSSGDTLQINSLQIFTAGNYAVSVVDGNGCQSLFSQLFSPTFYPLPAKPIIQVAGGGTFGFCQGDSINLQITPLSGATYSWSNGANSSMITVSQAGSFSVAVTDSNFCISPRSDTIMTTVYSLPSQPTIVAVGTTIFCDGDSVQLRAPAGYVNYVWSNGITDSLNTIFITDTLDVKVIDTNGCESPISAPTIVTVNALPPAPTIVANGPVSFCDGDSVQVEAPAGFAAYAWSNGISDSLQFISTSTNLTLRVTDANGCESSASATLAITHNPLPPQPVILATGSTTFCDGDSVQLKAPSGYVSYTWSNGATDSLTTIFVTDTLTVSVIDVNGCESPISTSAIVLVNVLPATPAITAQGPTTFCAGDSVQLKTTSGFANYLWSNGLRDSIVSIFTSDTLQLAVEDINGCISAVSPALIVTVNALPAQPTILANGPATFCDGDSVQLFVTGSFAAYTWSNGVQGDSSQWIFASDSLRMSVTDLNGCESPIAAQVIVTVNPNPAQPTIVALGSTTFCEGDSVQLQGPSGFTTYNWSNGGTGSTITITTTDTINLSVVDANGCESPLSTSRITRQNTLPAQPMILANGPLTFCDGDSVQLQAPAGFAAYRWSDGDTNPIRTIITAGDYQLAVTDSNGCESPFSDTSTVHVLTVPAQPMIIQLSADSLTSSVIGTSYQWFLNGNLLPDTTQTIFINQDGSYTVIVSNGPCSSVESDSLSTPLLELLPAESIQIFPNPNDGMFVIRGQFDRSSLLEFTFYNQLGQEIYRKELFAPQGVLNEVIQIDNLTDGIYIAQLRLNNRFSYKKVEVRR